MRKARESQIKQETKIGVIGKIYSTILDDYQDGKIAKSNNTMHLTEFMANKGFYVGKSWITCVDCGCLISANRRNKRRCKECNKEHNNNYHRTYQPEYQQKNPEKHKQYVENSSKHKYDGQFIYYLLNQKDEIKYIGETDNIYKRMHNHKSGNCECTKEFIKSPDFKCAAYINLENVISDYEVLEKLEAYLINNTDAELLNKDKESKRYSEITEEDIKLFDSLNLNIEMMNEWVF